MTTQSQVEPRKKRKTVLLNILFLIGCIIIVGFLLRAPEETTAPLPHNEIHEEFHLIKSKKAAEKSCLDCHGDGQQSPLSKDHPPKYRCLFCHKRI